MGKGFENLGEMEFWGGCRTEGEGVVVVVMVGSEKWSLGGTGICKMERSFGFV